MLRTVYKRLYTNRLFSTLYVKQSLLKKYGDALFFLKENKLQHSYIAHLENDIIYDTEIDDQSTFYFSKRTKLIAGFKNIIDDIMDKYWICKKEQNQKLNYIKRLFSHPKINAFNEITAHVINNGILKNDSLDKIDSIMTTLNMSFDNIDVNEISSATMLDDLFLGLMISPKIEHRNFLIRAFSDLRESSKRDLCRRHARYSARYTNIFRFYLKNDLLNFAGITTKNQFMEDLVFNGDKTNSEIKEMLDDVLSLINFGYRESKDAIINGMAKSITEIQIKQDPFYKQIELCLKKLLPFSMKDVNVDNLGKYNPEILEFLIPYCSTSYEKDRILKSFFTSKFDVIKWRQITTDLKLSLKDLVNINDIDSDKFTIIIRDIAEGRDLDKYNKTDMLTCMTELCSNVDYFNTNFIKLKRHFVTLIKEEAKNNFDTTKCINFNTSFVNLLLESKADIITKIDTNGECYLYRLLVFTNQNKYTPIADTISDLLARYKIDCSVKNMKNADGLTPAEKAEKYGIKKEKSIYL